MSVTDPFDTVREWREQFIAVTDPLDLWLCIGNYARPATKQETDIIAALASIEERLRSASRGWTAASTQREGYRKELEKADARVAELEAALREIMEKGAYDADYEIARAALQPKEEAAGTERCVR